jgi:hypothetical protein
LLGSWITDLTVNPVIVVCAATADEKATTAKVIRILRIAS